jgi:hypothetical protein
VAHRRTYVEIGKRFVLILPNQDVDITGRAHVIANTTGGSLDWEVVQFETLEKAQQFVAGVENAKNQLNALAARGCGEMGARRTRTSGPGERGE